jgi:hypothetical protein
MAVRVDIFIGLTDAAHERVSDEAVGSLQDDFRTIAGGFTAEETYGEWLDENKTLYTESGVHYIIYLNSEAKISEVEAVLKTFLQKSSQKAAVMEVARVDSRFVENNSSFDTVEKKK